MSRRTLSLLRWGIFIAACVFLFRRLAGTQGTAAGQHDWAAVLLGAGWAPWALLLLLAVLNQGLEARKWRLLLSDVQHIGAGRAWAATLAGVTLGLATPNRTGEFPGRVLFLAPEHRWRGGIATALGGLAQLAVTLLLGAMGLLLWWNPPDAWPVQGLAGTSLCVMAVASLAAAASVLFFSPRRIRRLLARLPLLRRLQRPAQVLERFDRRRLAEVFGMSLLRYLVFTAQYVLLLAVIAEVPWREGLLAVPVIFLVMTLVPTAFLTDLGVRGSVAVALLTPVGGTPALVLLAAMALWTVNLALPALCGGCILWFTRLPLRG